MSDQGTFKEHLSELKVRAIIILIFFLFFSFISYLNYDLIIGLITAPIKDKLYYSAPAGAFNLMIQICLSCALVFTFPIAFYQILKFLEPAFEKLKSQNYFLLIFSSISLAILGILFAYYICIPATINFLQSFESNELNALISVDEYFSFIMTYIWGFALIFQLPLVMIIIHNIFGISVKNILKAQKAVIIISFIFAAILTPTPDIFNQSLLALPIIFIFYSGILLILAKKFLYRKTKA